MTPRVALERAALARLLNARDLATLRRWLLGLRLFGIGRDHFAGDMGRAFAAIVALAGRGEQVNVEAVVREAGGRVDRDHLAWLRVAYGDGDSSLYALALSLVDADRRAKGDGIGAVFRNAMRDPAVDVDQAIAAAVGALRRLARKGGVSALRRTAAAGRTPHERAAGEAPIVVRPGGLRVRRVGASGGAWPR